MVVKQPEHHYRWSLNSQNIIADGRLNSQNIITDGRLNSQNIIADGR